MNWKPVLVGYGMVLLLGIMLIILWPSRPLAIFLADIWSFISLVLITIFIVLQTKKLIKYLKRQKRSKNAGPPLSQHVYRCRRSLNILSEKTIYLKNSRVVIVKPNTEIGDRNIFCFDYSGKIKWQVPAPPQLHQSNYFTGIYLREGELYAYSLNGVEFHLDKETGVVVDSALIK